MENGHRGRLALRAAQVLLAVGCGPLLEGCAGGCAGELNVNGNATGFGADNEINCACAIDGKTGFFAVCLPENLQGPVGQPGRIPAAMTQGRMGRCWCPFLFSDSPE
jgi:hypothetical protein